jgi:hypothetical protein
MREEEALGRHPQIERRRKHSHLLLYGKHTEVPQDP